MDIANFLQQNTKIVASRTPVTAELGGEAILLDPVSGLYYGLRNDVGVRIWQLVQTAITVDDLRTAILSEYEVEQQQCDRDLSELLQHLISNNLVEVVDAASAYA